MKRSIVVSCVLLALAVAVCVWADAAIERALDHADALRLRALAMAESGDEKGAVETITRLAAYWAKCEPLMEMLTSHEDIHRVREAFVSAKLLLQRGDHVGFEESMALLGEWLEHIHTLETISLANIF